MNEIDEIRQEMARIRHDLHQDVAGVVVGATDVMDWRAHLRAHPWATAGIAFAIGYLLVPKRSNPPEIIAIPSPVPPPSNLAGLESPPVGLPVPKRSVLSPWRLMGWALSFAGPIALNAAQAYASVWLENQLGIKPGAPDRPDSDRPRDRGNGPGSEGRPGFSASASRAGRAERGI